MDTEKEERNLILDEDNAWVYSGLDVTVLSLDARVLAFFLIVLVRIRLSSFIIFLAAVCFFYILKIFDLNVSESIKRLRLSISMIFFGNIKKIN